MNNQRPKKDDNTFVVMLTVKNDQGIETNIPLQSLYQETQGKTGLNESQQRLAEKKKTELEKNENFNSFKTEFNKEFKDKIETPLLTELHNFQSPNAQVTDRTKQDANLKNLYDANGNTGLKGELFTISNKKVPLRQDLDVMNMIKYFMDPSTTITKQANADSYTVISNNQTIGKFTKDELTKISKAINEKLGNLSLPGIKSINVGNELQTKNEANTAMNNKQWINSEGVDVNDQFINLQAGGHRSNSNSNSKANNENKSTQNNNDEPTANPEKNNVKHQVTELDIAFWKVALAEIHHATQNTKNKNTEGTKKALNNFEKNLEGFINDPDQQKDPSSLLKSLGTALEEARKSAQTQDIIQLDTKFTLIYGNLDTPKFKPISLRANKESDLTEALEKEQRYMQKRVDNKLQNLFKNDAKTGAKRKELEQAKIQQHDGTNDNKHTDQEIGKAVQHLIQAATIDRGQHIIPDKNHKNHNQKHTIESTDTSSYKHMKKHEFTNKFLEAITTKESSSSRYLK